MSGLGATIVVRHLTAACNGQCGGDIELVTDGFDLAYASTGCYGDTPYVSGDAPGVARREDGSIEVLCGARHGREEHRCTGTATFTREEQQAGHWSAAGHWPSLFTRMEQA